MVTLLLQRAPDRRLGDAVAGRQFGHRLARGVTLGDLAALADVELGLVAELLAFGLGSMPDWQRLRINDRSNSATPDMTAIGSRPTSVVVSHQPSPRLVKP